MNQLTSDRIKDSLMEESMFGTFELVEIVARNGELSIESNELNDLVERAIRSVWIRRRSEAKKESFTFSAVLYFLMSL